MYGERFQQLSNFDTAAFVAKCAVDNFFYPNPELRYTNLTGKIRLDELTPPNKYEYFTLGMWQNRTALKEAITELSTINRDTFPKELLEEILTEMCLYVHWSRSYIAEYMIPKFGATGVPSWFAFQQKHRFVPPGMAWIQLRNLRPGDPVYSSDFTNQDRTTNVTPIGWLSEQDFMYEMNSGVVFTSQARLRPSSGNEDLTYYDMYKRILTADRFVDGPNLRIHPAVARDFACDVGYGELNFSEVKSLLPNAFFGGTFRRTTGTFKGEPTLPYVRVDHVNHLYFPEPNFESTQYHQ